ncbi:DUF883 family protein [Roseateles amylovorans]|uniref:DUF883 domain-containing protein n=1 Tax=Roseateles amylovorans TaxID=2978473 RepID=A0ABY6B5K1_9BURK|nr:hypothetical protein [Roseateles amylovorans]UXH80534.1 hypothetical protein N4261_11950 [Roseateles amylovorans]
MSTTPSNEKTDKTVPFTTSEDAAKASVAQAASSASAAVKNGATPSSTTGVDLVNRVAQTAHATIDKLANQATPAVQHLQKSLEDTGDLLHQRADQARNVGNEWCESLRGSVRQHPLAAVGTALAVGLLIARLTR